MARISHSSTLPLVEFPFLWPDEINRDLDMFTDQLLPQKLSGLVGIMSLSGVGLPKMRGKVSRGHEISEGWR